MFGLQFIHWSFLGLGLAVAVPLIIHLLFRQRTRTVMIGSVQFLQQVVREHRHRRRIRQWLLLALRMLAILLLALLFARPFQDKSALSGLQQEVVVLIDRSASMQARDARGKSAFERALDTARQELQKYDENVVVHIAACDSTGIEEWHLEDLAQAHPGQAATDYNLALSWAGDLLNASKRTRRRVLLICDLQRSGLFRGKNSRLPDGIDLIVHDVGEALARNVVVESVQPTTTEIRKDGALGLRVVLRNYGAWNVRQAPLRVELQGPQGTVKAEQAVDLTGQSTLVLDLPLSIQTDGLYQGFVEIQATDELALDNRRWVAFEARHADRVLLIDGQEGRAVFANETYYLETALRLRSDEISGTERSFEPERIAWEAGQGFPRLDGYRAVVLTNVRRLSDTDATRLADYLKGGGSLLIFAGDQVSRESLAPLAHQHLLPGELASDPVSGRFLVSEWNSQHPALTCFTDPQHGDLRRVSFSRILPVQNLAEGSTVLLQSGETMIAAERPVGRGRCIYLGTTADRDWTDLPRTRLYVPLMRQFLAYLTDQLGNRAAVVNQIISRTHPQAGIEPASEIAGSCVVTNLDPRESALQRVTEEELQLALGGDTETAAAEEREAALRLFLPADSLRPEELWTAITWILLLVLSIETLVASRVHA
ncbi:MAG: BatA domain-containing protein [Planctomycetes bacterium]|nr:BatA domain-containing protein [Planctomycetota bacterium]